MNKPFDSWNAFKKTLDNIDTFLLFQEREIWFVHTGINIGIEKNGKGKSFSRPVLILRKYNKQHFLGIPLTTQVQAEHISYELKNISFLKQASYLVLSQVRAYDARRLDRRLGKLSHQVFDEIKIKSARTFVRASVPNGK